MRASVASASLAIDRIARNGWSRRTRTSKSTYEKSSPLRQSLPRTLEALRIHHASESRARRLGDLLFQHPAKHDLHDIRLGRVKAQWLEREWLIVRVRL